MIETEIRKKRRQLNESIENNHKYEDVYKLSVELDELITEFYRKSKSKARVKDKLTNKSSLRKILYIA